MTRKPKIPAAIRPFMKDGPSPLAIIEGVARMHLAASNFELAARYAIEAAPYRHAKAVAIAALPGQGELFDVDPVTRRPVLGFEWQQAALAAPVIVDEATAEMHRKIREDVARMTPQEREARIAQLQRQIAESKSSEEPDS